MADVQKLLEHSSEAITTKVYRRAGVEGVAEVYARYHGALPPRPGPDGVGSNLAR